MSMRTLTRYFPFSISATTTMGSGLTMTSSLSGGMTTLLDGSPSTNIGYMEPCLKQQPPKKELPQTESCSFNDLIMGMERIGLSGKVRLSSCSSWDVN